MIPRPFHFTLVVYHSPLHAMQPRGSLPAWRSELPADVHPQRGQAKLAEEPEASDEQVPMLVPCYNAESSTSFSLHHHCNCASHHLLNRIPTAMRCFAHNRPTFHYTCCPPSSTIVRKNRP